MKLIIKFSIYFLLLILTQCGVDTDKPEYDPSPYILKLNGDFPDPAIPTDNELTNAKVKLGKMLFYEKKLSKDLTQSCAGCHIQKDGFSDLRDFSIGVENKEGKRNAMALFNLAFHENGFFWDGRVMTLREQVLRPIQDPLEMNETLANVVMKIQNDKRYTDQFQRAFGNDSVDSRKISFALEQFMMSIVSHDSRYDQYLKGSVNFNESELRGKNLFFSESDPINNIKGAECFHCHGGFNFTNNEYHNNGLDEDNGFKDFGRYEVTKNISDQAKFKVPSLRNIALTPPYMHDSRFKNLDEVLNHYNSGVKNSTTLSILLQHSLTGLNLNSQDIKDLIAFLNTLTDFSYINNPEYKNPF
jgi:cytochrome c peroxidase